MASLDTLLDQPAGVAARRIALANLDRAAEAGERFCVSEDAEALHDFRVGLRRLRATLRGYRQALDHLATRKIRHTLRDLAEASTLARDTEVQLAWLEQQRPDMRANERAGYRWLHRHWQTRLLAEYLLLRERIHDEFAALDRRLRSRCREDIDNPATGTSMKEAFAEALACTLPAFADALSSLAASVDPQGIHPPRLIGKRLRYLIDPLAAEIDGARECGRALARLQDLLGDIHDRQVLRPALFEAAEAAGAARYRLMLDVATDRQADPKALAQVRRSAEAPGLAQLARRAREEEDALMQQLRHWLASGAADTLIAHLRRLQESLDPARPEPAPESSD